MTLPLADVTVVALEQAVAAPFATRQLADLGATVIKIERPDGGDFARSYDQTVNGLSSHFVWLNRSKRSLTLDLKNDGARPVVDRLLDRADVFVSNLAPGAAGRLGLGPEQLVADHPRLVVCSITGYGSTGPFRDRKAYDLLIQSEVGVASLTGTPDAPSKVGIPVADIAAGMYAYSGILAALYERERTGRGQAIEVSLFDALSEWMGYPLYYTKYGGIPPGRHGLAHAAIAPYGPFETAQGSEFVLAVQNDREWQAFCAEVVGDGDLADDPRFASNSDRLEHREALQTEIEGVLSTLDHDDLLKRVTDAGIAYAAVNDVQAFLDHPQLSQRGRWSGVGSPVGEVAALLPPVISDDHEPRMDPVPDLGEHTAAVLGELGFNDDEIDRLRQQSVV